MNFPLLNMMLPQFIVSLFLFLVFGFGLSFIINMIAKTTWFPSIASGLALVGFSIERYISEGDLYTIVDYAVLICGVLGTLISAWTIKTLREKGYRMF